jgi:hypothetical protein
MTSMAHVVYEGGRFSKEVEARRAEVKTVEIGEGVERIDDLAFFCFTGLVSLIIPPSVKTIGSQCFVGCENLEAVHIPSTVVAIGDNAFLRCARLRTLALPPNLQDIGKAVFKKCQRLESVNVPSTVTSIGPHAFEGCTELKTLVLPESVRHIGHSAFEGCKQLMLVVSETASLGSIGDCAFAGIAKVTFVCAELPSICHAFGPATIPKPEVFMRTPEKPVDLFKKFLRAETTEAVVLSFYKMRVSLGLEAVAKGPVEERFEGLRDKLLPLCDDFSEGVEFYKNLSSTVEAADRRVANTAVCVVGGGPVGIRCAIELAILGQEVSVLEQLTTTEIAQRSRTPAVIKWPEDDLRRLGADRTDPTTVHNSTRGRPHSRSVGSLRNSNSGAMANAPVRSGTVRAAALEVDLLRVALVLGVRFMFGSSFLAAEAMGKTHKKAVRMDHTHGMKAVMAEGNIGRGGLSKQDFFLATFGIAVRDGSPIEDIVNSRCFKTLLAVNCHAVVNAGGVRGGSSAPGGTRGACGGIRGSVRLSNSDCLAQARVLSKKGLRDLSYVSTTATSRASRLSNGST